MKDGPPDPATPGEAGVTDLVARLWSDITALVRAEAALVRADLGAAKRALLRAAIIVGVGLVAGVAALMALTGAAVAALVEAGLSPAWAGLCVGAGAVLLAVICLIWAAALVRRATGLPARTARNLRRDVETLASMVKNDA